MKNNEMFLVRYEESSGFSELRKYRTERAAEHAIQEETALGSEIFTDGYAYEDDGIVAVEHAMGDPKDFARWTRLWKQ